ncbi:hypothetical protein OPT61_g5783 [Boeremia exigua]|uniref:Uncharacterized protein n=1 Tax=Boeremia exigua TaxID=749465 RepID=A0ACC2I913_9PLEO|nr:hypothetical protein OPT61_g5783 [Boeremia exigua]
MKSALILALAGSAVAAPSFGDFLDALFGGDKDHDRPRPTDFPGLPPVGTGSGLPFPFPTATGAPLPPFADGVSANQPFPYPDSQKKRHIKALHIDYQLAPTAAPEVKRRALKYRQLGGSALPSFTLLDPNDVPAPTQPANGLPTELPTQVPTELPGLPTETAVPTEPAIPTETASPVLPTEHPTELPGLPTGLPTPPAGGPTAPLPGPTGEPSLSPGGEAPFPTDAPFPTVPAGTGAPDFPGLPTTFGTVTRGPLPTPGPDAPEQEDGEETQDGSWWMQLISDLLSGSRGSRD